MVRWKFFIILIHTRWQSLPNESPRVALCMRLLLSCNLGNCTQPCCSELRRTMQSAGSKWKDKGGEGAERNTSVVITTRGARGFLEEGEAHYRRLGKQNIISPISGVVPGP